MSYPAAFSADPGRGIDYVQAERERLGRERKERYQEMFDQRELLSRCQRNRTRSAEHLDELESRATTFAVGLASQRDGMGLEQLRKLEIEILAEKRIIASYDLAEAAINERIAKLQGELDALQAEQAAEAAKARASDLQTFAYSFVDRRVQILRAIAPAERQAFIAGLSPHAREHWEKNATPAEIELVEST